MDEMDSVVRSAEMSEDPIKGEFALGPMIHSYKYVTASPSLS